MTRVSVWGLGLVCVGFLAGCAKSGKAGDRAAECDEAKDGVCDSTTASCPYGELCSPKTPNGLRFGMNALFDEDSPFDSVGFKTLARGGTTRVSFSKNGGDSKEPSKDLPFVADARDGIGLLPLPPDDPHASHVVLVEGLETGEGLLRILDPEYDALYDRTSITVANVDNIRLSPVFAWSLAEDGGHPNGGEWAYLKGEESLIGIKLRAANGKRLVNERMEVSVAGQIVPRGSAWDVRVVTPAETGPLEFSIKTVGGAVISASFEVVDAADDFIQVDYIGIPVEAGSEEQVGGSLESGDSRIYCFRPLAGKLSISTKIWQYTGAGSITAEGNGTHCAFVEAGSPGAGTLTVAAGGFSKSFSFTVKK